MASFLVPTAAGEAQDLATQVKANKITIVGVGQVGMACAFSILTNKLAGELVLADIDEKKLRAEVLDLQHGGAFLHSRVTQASASYSETAGSDIVIITAGAKQKQGERRLELLERNCKIMKAVVQPVAEQSPKAILLVLSNPVDVMTYAAWKLSGLPAHRVIGGGCYLDTSRLRVMLARQLGTSAKSVHAYVIGEHGDSSVACWSSAMVGGLSIADHVPEADMAQLLAEVRESAFEVQRGKGYTNWAIASATASLCAAILLDKRSIVPVSTNAAGLCGVTEDCYTSLPVVLGRNGVHALVPLKLSASEQAMFDNSVATLLAAQRQTGL